MTRLLLILVKEDKKDKRSCNRHIYTQSFFLTHDYPNLLSTEVPPQLICPLTSHSPKLSH